MSVLANGARAVALPAPSAGVVAREIHDGAVLFDPGTETYFSLNSVGAKVWSLLPPASATVGELCDALLVTYPDATAEQVFADVSSLLAALRAQNLVYELSA